jgi:hypothetical protein
MNQCLLFSQSAIDTPWVQLPVNNSAPIKEVASFQSVDQLLEDGFGAVVRLFRDGDTNMPVKANAFLASSSRIDDDRMLKYKISDAANKKFLRVTYSVGEREKMMGLPIGYVQDPMGNLFNQLSVNAFLNPEMAVSKTYRDFLPRSLWHFRRECKFKFKPLTELAEPPFFQLALSSPLEGKQNLSFYTKEEYCKHLIGNGWSIPVVEHLLGNLKGLFAEDALMTYEGYTDAHPWEPYLSL